MTALQQTQSSNPATHAQGTYPLDTVRLRMAVDPGARSMRGAAAALMREGSQGAFFRGLGTSMAGACFFRRHPHPFVLWELIAITTACVGGVWV